MKVLLDECLPVDFRHSFLEHETHTVVWAGLKGKKNGEFLREADAAGYDVLVTIDQAIPRQQRDPGRRLSILVLRAATNQLEDLVPLAAPIKRALERIGHGEIVMVG